MMPQMIKFAGLMVLLFLVSGCTGLNKIPIEKNYYDLVLKHPLNSHRVNSHRVNNNQADTDKTRYQGDSIIVREFLIASAFDSHSFILRVKNDEYINDYYNEFISYPARLITEKFFDQLTATPHFSSAQTKAKQGIAYRLSGKITKLYGDFQTPASPKAIIELQLILEKKSKKNFAVVISKTYAIDIPIESQSPTNLVSGWSKGLSAIITQFLIDFTT
ncbi:MAG: hypothetical protein L3J69_02230 [Desulfobacula sp.]|nr:hypothetical protein [Desulfobacula sp.]